MKKYKYDVALSFAGQDRDFARAVANTLKSKGIEVFYDEDADLWGKDLPAEFREIYYRDSRFCIMIVSDHYVKKMWPTVERRNATERFVEEKGKEYILPVYLDGFSGEVPGLPSTVGCLFLKSTEPGRVITQFLKKIKGHSQNHTWHHSLTPSPEPFIPKLKRSYSDLDKKRFLKSSFKEIVAFIDKFSGETQSKYPNFEYEFESVTSRKVLFTLYNDGKELTRFKIWIDSGVFKDQICLYHGSSLELDNDSATNEMVCVENYEGELKLRTLDNTVMNSQEVAEHFWKVACSGFSY